MSGPDSWAVRNFNCVHCDKITPQIPYLQNWGPAWRECVFCGQKNLFSKFSKYPSDVNFRFYLKKEQWEGFNVREFIKNERT